MGIASREVADVPPAPARLRVLLAVGPAVGGMAQHVAELARGLDRDRFEAALAARADDPAALAALSMGCVVYPMRFALTPLNMAVYARRLGRLVRRERFDLVHAHGYSASGAAALARRMTPRAKLVCTLHGFLTTTRAQPARGWRARWLLGLIARRADCVTMVSDSLREQFAGMDDHLRGKVVVVPNGVDMTKFAAGDRTQARRELGLEGSGPVVGMVARLAAQKGPLDFVRAAAQVALRFPEAQFVLIGDGPLRAEVEALARQLGLANRLRLAGYREDGPRLTQAFEVAVVSSVSEGSSLTAMEAMAWGVPVVAFAAGGVREVVVDGETGVLVPPGDARALSDAIGSLLGNPDRAQRLGDAGRSRVKREFSLARMIERTQEVYLSVAHSTDDVGGARCA